ncbi:MAG: hypothetical protein EZS26_000494 [Candidatus Ordinivivax streblomastigis]|uniref:Uncharacterized protein n=1 Tax=Candidatus Ordinivivax streblomastigis TaxID=2540710 RepID=A0A5M8P4N9_9BACT|nr:MAG: hypothetical protein EZS26_000473 [Candidatus Ordinivivax streblomastigis]KAA6303334.1 MAG: hypothetical protein EZS26_000494 [Candidatus Ordinivivax streblomastigis]
MPTSPKFGNIARKIGKSKIAHQIKTKQSGCSYRNIGITRKITIDLESEEKGAHQQLWHNQTYV